MASRSLAQDQEQEHSAWVYYVQAFQKTSRDARARWNDYCDVYGEGARDPRRHRLEFLKHFFELRAQGGLPELEASTHERSLQSASSEQEYRTILEGKVHHAMRVQSFRRYFRRQFGTVKVKALDSEALLEFLQKVQEADKTKDPYVSPGNFQSPWAQCVRKLQSRRLTWKLQWDAYVESRGRGVRDPSRHRPEFLAIFLNQVSPPCPRNMLQEFGLRLDAMQVGEVNPPIGGVSPTISSSDPDMIEDVQFTEAPENMQCSSVRNHAAHPEVHAESNAWMVSGEGGQRRLQFGLRLEDIQVREVNLHSGGVRPTIPRSEPDMPEDEQLTRAPGNWQCFSMESHAAHPEVHAETNARMVSSEGCQQHLQPHGDAKRRSSSWPSMRPLCGWASSEASILMAEAGTSYALSYHVRNTFLEFH